MRDKILFSIIVPVYNCENYIQACLESILSQTYSDYELIIVDDGSTDTSVVQIKEIIKDLPNCQLLLNQHGGVCKARNTGIQLAKGEYICLIDADDIVFNDYLESLASVILSNSPDVIYFQMKTGIDLSYIRCETTCPVILLDKNDINLLSKATLYHIPELYDRNSKLFGISSFSACGQIYKSDLFKKHNITFTEGITRSEDGLINLELLYYAETGAVIQKELYMYRTENNSATRSYKKDLVEVFRFRDECVKRIINTFYKVEYDDYLHMYYCSLIYELRAISENCIFHKNNNKPYVDKEKDFLCLINTSDYVQALHICSSDQLMPEDAKYLLFAQTGNVKKLIRYLAYTQSKRRLRSYIKEILIKTKLLGLIRKIRQKN
ncbi:MAG: glycosyltransferase family 2 protein [Clostridia bacterium]|nr:glycosyltransferase family 2 protein [Clostridia bacterium]